MISSPRWILVVALVFPILFAAGNWPRWRGPEGVGHVDDSELPKKLSADGVKWKTQLPGDGQSSPIYWGDQIFLTAASNDASRIILALDRSTGKIEWQETVWKGSGEPLHNMNGFASATCATDGEHVVAFFGKGGLHCFTVKGEKLWSKDLGAFEGPWGTGASPVIIGDLVVQNCDADNAAFLVAFNKKTGEQVWRTERPVVRGWSTPILIEAGDRNELVINGHTGVTAYDPATGKELWFCKGDRGRGTPSVVTYKDSLIAVAGRPGDMIAVKPGGTGTVNNTHEIWRVKRTGGRDLPSPIVIGDRLFVMNMPGIGSCYDAASGKELWRHRFGGNFSSSPIAADGAVYIVEESGVVLAFRLGASGPEMMGESQIPAGNGEIFRASLTPCDGKWLCRSNNTLYCIGK